MGLQTAHSEKATLHEQGDQRSCGLYSFGGWSGFDTWRSNLFVEISESSAGPAGPRRRKVLFSLSRTLPPSLSPEEEGEGSHSGE